MSKEEKPQQHGLHNDTADFLFQRIEEWRKRNADNKCFYDLLHLYERVGRMSRVAWRIWLLTIGLLIVLFYVLVVLEQERVLPISGMYSLSIVLGFISSTFLIPGFYFERKKKFTQGREPIITWRYTTEERWQFMRWFHWGIQHSCWATKNHLVVCPHSGHEFVRHDGRRINWGTPKEILQEMRGYTVMGYVEKLGYSWAEVIDMGIQLGNEPSAEKIAINTTLESKQLLEEFCGIIEETAQFEQNRLKEENLRMEKEQAIFDDRLSTKLQELDKDGNGVVDDIEGDDAFEALLQKHEALLVEKEKEFSQKFVHKFIRMSSYLTQQRDNIQRIFTLLSKSQNHKSLDENLELLQSEIHTYQLLLLNSINMVTLLADNKVIDFWKTYEVFDELNVYDSNYQRQLAEELGYIGDGLNELMGSIDRMNLSMSRQLSSLHRLTESNGASMQKQLNSVNSNLKVNNVLNAVQIYQNRKTNKRLG